MKIASRMDAIKPSATIGMKVKADQLKQEGKDVLSFAVGEPDFPTPDNVVEAAKAALDAGETKYTAASGTNELKQAICDATERDLGLSYDPANVLVSNGAKHSLMNIAEVMYDPGDEIICFSPYWVTYPVQAQFVGAKPVAIETRGEDDFQPDLARVRAAVTDSTVAIMINSPCNPTGAVYAPEIIEGIADIAVEHDLTIVSDEIYKHIRFDDAEHVSPAQLGDGVRSRTLIVDGVAKTYAMTGWRIGWILGDAAWIKRAGALQGQATSCPNTIAQAATIEALGGPQDSVAEMVEQFAARRDFVMDRLGEVPGVTCARPRGAFYAFPNISEHYGRELGGKKIEGSLDMAEYLLEEGLISLVPGQAFGAEDYIRISFAASMEQLDEGLKRFKEALA
ncbi:MAG: aminotransferase class I/II-fold pyridoxal phosphate-dependent enzyme [Armatimonadia bacterium]|nr:aminotransferase class I/II-fold pyridoxal phosphate-dependent enzyme [Armatimonadia bacterium]